MTQKELNIQRLLKEAGERSMLAQTRRHFLNESAMGLGALAMGALLGSCGGKSPSYPPVVFDPARPLLPRPPHFPGKAKQVIYLHMAGAPSQLEMFDFKPELKKTRRSALSAIFAGRKKICIHQRCSKNVGPAGNIQAVRSIRGLSIGESPTFCDCSR